MNFLDEQKRAEKAAPILLEILENSGRFNETFQRYRDADGPVDGDFLAHLDAARAVWKRATDESVVDDVLALPVSFREAVFFGLRRAGDAAALQRLLDGAREKDAKKRLKRLLHELREAGIHGPEKKRERFFGKPTTAVAEEPPCLVTPVDSRGERLILLNFPVKAGVQHVEVYERNGDRVVAFHEAATSRKSVRSYTEELRNRSGLPANDVPAPYAYFLIDRLAKRAKAADNPFPAGFLTALSRLRPPFPVLAQHPYRERVDAQAVLDRLANLSESDRLNREPEIMYWAPDRETMRRFELMIQELETSSLVLDERQRAEQMQTRTARLINQYFTSAMRATYADRLHDAAYEMAGRGAKVEAETAAALALYLESPQREPGDVPFFTHLLLKLLPEKADPSEPSATPSGLIL